MKPKILLLSLIILVIIIVISFLMSAGGVKNQPAQETKVIPQEPAALVEQAQQLPFPDEHKSIISITKQQPKVKPQELTEKKAPPATAQAEKPIPATSSTATAQNVSASTGNQTEQGIVKIEKRPSKEQMNEMRAHGIVLY